MKTYTPIKEGKVREVYDLGDCMIIEATDRISAFDVILGSVIPDRRIIIISDYSPFALIIPTFFVDFFHSPEDYYQKPKNITITRIIKLRDTQDKKM